ncbi:hypothetical protein D9M69_725180 [compost metagenome]
MFFADEAERLVKGEGVRIFLCAAVVENGCKVSATTEPLACGHDHAGVHMDGWHIRVLRMRDQ